VVADTPELIREARFALSYPVGRATTCAVMVTYHPGPEVLASIAAVRPQVDRLVVVDNGSRPEAHACLEELRATGEIELISNPENLGVASALNIGFRWAMERGYAWLLTLDQDTICEPDMVEKLFFAFGADADPDSVGVLAPVHFDRETGYVSPHLRNLPAPVVRRRYVMTSGNLIPTRALLEVGWYDDDFFIEYVDHDFCLRAGKKGYRVLLVRDARMGHQLGQLKRHELRIGPFGLWFFSHNYAPVRRYYRARNRIHLYRRYFGWWMLQDFGFWTRDWMKIVLVEENRMAKLKAWWLGTFDGIFGRLGRFEGAHHKTPKSPRYYVEFRKEILPLLPEVAERSLDIGCGTGETSARLKELGRVKWAAGLEGNPVAAETAAKRLDFVERVDLDRDEFPVADQSLDLVLALDVLEHLVDPWSVLAKLQRKLKPGGVAVLSLPNVRHHSALLPLLLLGDFKYQTEGVLDSTHLRFFTKTSAIRFVEDCGFELLAYDHTGAKRGLGGWATRLTLGTMKEFFIYQHLLLIRPRPSTPRPV
jgi:rhamnosyltransferase